MSLLPHPPPPQSPQWHSPFPPQKVQFIETGFNECPNIHTSLKPLPNTRNDENELCSWVFLSLHWVKKVCSEYVSFVSPSCFHFDPLGYKGENISIFPNELRVREGNQKHAFEPNWAQLPSPFPDSGPLVGTSYCFHNTVTENVPQRLSTCTTALFWKTNQPKSSYPEVKSSALKVTETSLVQFKRLWFGIY